MEKEEEIKKYVSSAIMKADNQLKDQIMHQIEVESTLIPKKTASSSVFVSYLPFKLLFILFPIVGSGLYFNYGETIFSSLALYSALIFISSSICLFWMISIIDDQWRNKNKVSAQP